MDRAGRLRSTSGANFAAYLPLPESGVLFGVEPGLLLSLPGDGLFMPPGEGELVPGFVAGLSLVSDGLQPTLATTDKPAMVTKTIDRKVRILDS